MPSITCRRLGGERAARVAAPRRSHSSAKRVRDAGATAGQQTLEHANGSRGQPLRGTSGRLAHGCSVGSDRCSLAAGLPVPHRVDNGRPDLLVDSLLRVEWRKHAVECEPVLGALSLRSSRRRQRDGVQKLPPRRDFTCSAQKHSARPLLTRHCTERGPNCLIACLGSAATSLALMGRMRAATRILSSPANKLLPLAAASSPSIRAMARSASSADAVRAVAMRGGRWQGRGQQMCGRARSN